MDLLSRPLWSAICTTTVSPAAARLLTRDDLKCVSNLLQARAVVDAAEQQFMAVERSLPEIGLQYVHLTDYIVSTTEPVGIRAEASKVQERCLSTPHDGALLEEDVADLLARIFPKHCIFVNSMKKSDGKELCDILVVTDEDVLVVQAKKRIYGEADGAEASGDALTRSEKMARTGLKHVLGSCRELERGDIELKMPGHRLECQMKELQEASALPYVVVDDAIRIPTVGKRRHGNYQVDVPRPYC